MLANTLRPSPALVGLILSTICLFMLTQVKAKQVSHQVVAISTESPPSPMIEFAQELLHRQLRQLHHHSNIHSIMLTQDSAVAKQGFIIQPQGQQLTVRASDDHGFMYALLEIKEQISFGTSLANVTANQQPHFRKRGLKFNIPLDARNPSYDDTGSSAQQNIEAVWDFDFWRHYLDKMALNRYNQLTLWNPQPFTSMLALDKYPGLALDDVYKSTAPLDSRIGAWGEAGGVSPLVLKSLQKVITFPIQDKIKFWRKVMAYAKSRGIDIYLITWSIYTNGIGGQYGIDESIDNPKTVAFFREAVKELIITYPDLKGIGITAGERMPADGEVENWSREKWLWQTYGLGLADAKVIKPNREVSFIHRFWYSGYKEIADYWGDYPDDFSFSFKYIMARLYSSSSPSHIAEKVIPTIQASARKTWWNLRNDDIFVYRWGDPEYARNFYTNIPTDITEGIHMGSDGYVWGKTNAEKFIDGSNRYEIDKHWYRFMIWGRLAYNLELSKRFFVNQLKLQFVDADAEKLYLAWQAASRIIPTVNQYQFEPGDRNFAAESVSSRETFRYVNDFQVAKSMPKSGVLNARNYVKKSLAKHDLRAFVSPFKTAKRLNRNAKLALSLAQQLDTKNANNVLQRTLDDIRAFAYLGQYYSAKISTAVWLEFYQQDKQRAKYAVNAKRQIASALKAWQQYRHTSEKHYHPQMLARVGLLDWQALEQEVMFEVTMVDKILNNPFLIPSTNDPQNQLSLDYDKTLNGESRHQRLQIFTPDAGKYRVDVYQENGVWINSYQNKENGPARWEWFQDQQQGVYYLNLQWRDLNRVIKVDWSKK
ncbi:hypothetical protein RS130_15580 [Paraglaciecola aquimarina]|uniref:Uncharacterized protein n=1 Tax=Paraglaciecola aquimarina TaxID=1235557 RepID=A0ABU3SYP5_9ALTE|nr:hypothetical protein [Paraglaciecola aquimarina]MDU0355132.1 hypothetical protein [Paraglaciecola aquimarina]